MMVYCFDMTRGSSEQYERFCERRLLIPVRSIAVRPLSLDLAEAAVSRQCNVRAELLRPFQKQLGLLKNLVGHGLCLKCERGARGGGNERNGADWNWAIAMSTRSGGPFKSPPPGRDAVSLVLSKTAFKDYTNEREGGSRQANPETPWHCRRNKPLRSSGTSTARWPWLWGSVTG